MLAQVNGGFLRAVTRRRTPRPIAGVQPAADSIVTDSIVTDRESTPDDPLDHDRADGDGQRIELSARAPGGPLPAHWLIEALLRVEIGLALLDDGGLIRWCNPFFEAQHPPADWVGRHVLDLHGADDPVYEHADALRLETDPQWVYRFQREVDGRPIRYALRRLVGPYPGFLMQTTSPLGLRASLGPGSITEVLVNTTASVAPAEWISSGTVPEPVAELRGPAISTQVVPEAAVVHATAAMPPTVTSDAAVTKHAGPAEQFTFTVTRRSAFVAIGMVLVLANGALAGGVERAWVTAPLGLAAIMGVPLFLLYHCFHRRSTISERLGRCVAAVVLLLMAAALVLNTAGILLGARALDTAPVIVTFDVVLAGMALWAFRRHPASYLIRVPQLGPKGWALIAAVLSLPLLALIGSVRLNNGHGSAVIVAMLGLTCLLLALLLSQRSTIANNLAPLAIYCIALALLLMTSNRGWYATGHDVQNELRMFRMTSSLGIWRMSNFRDAYNACLSITLLPTVLLRWTRLEDVLVFKLVFQLMFAWVPVLVYALVRRFGTPLLALLATVNFFSFVTFFQDMPSLNRQEVAFLFMVCALLALFDDKVGAPQRRAAFTLMVVGMVLAHYSTSYLMLAAVMGTWVLRWIVGRFVSSAPTKVFTASVVAILVVITGLWAGPATQTHGALTRTFTELLDALSGQALAHKSGDTGYTLFSPSKPTALERIEEYRQDIELRTVADREQGSYYDAAVVDSYRIRPAEEENLPLTWIGRRLSALGLNVNTLNGLVRQGSAMALQLCVFIGCIILLRPSVTRDRISLEFRLLGFANIGLLVAQVVLPVLSVDYGVLRSFQQALVVLGFFIALTLTSVLARFRRSRVLISMITVGYFASSVGLITHVLGGYPAQIHLDSAGMFYENYYLEETEVKAMEWVVANVPPDRLGDVQSEVQSDRFSFASRSAPRETNEMNDIFPALVRQQSYVFLGATNIRKGTAGFSFGGDIVRYRYPLSFLDEQKI